MCSITRREEPTITMMMKFELKLSSTKSLKFIFTKMSIILETLTLLAANIYSTLCSESQGMNLCVKVQCIFHSAGCESAALLHKSHGLCDFPWMQAFWHCVYLLFVMHVSSSQCSMSTHPPALLPCVVFSSSLPPFSPSFLSCPLSLTIKIQSHTLHVTTQCVRVGCSRCWVLLEWPEELLNERNFFF